MASIGEVGANNASKMIRGEKDEVPLCIYFGVFFDGTGEATGETGFSGIGGW